MSSTTKERMRCMTGRIVISAAFALASFFADGAATWSGLEDASHMAGAKVSESDLLGKAVLVYYWDAAEEDSVKYLAEVEKVWNSFKTKKFVIVGSYQGSKDAAKVKELVQKNKVTFPVYHKFSLDPDPKPGFENPPYFNVVSHRGVGLYNGGGIKEAQVKVVDAISAIGMPVSLCGDVELKKFKALGKQLALGKNVSPVLKKLEKMSTSKDPAVASEAQEIMSAVESAKNDVKSDIEMYSTADPAEAIKIIGLFIKTWPKDDSAKTYKESLPDLKKAAAEKAKAAKEIAKGAAK